MLFEDRVDAGKKLAEKLIEYEQSSSTNERSLPSKEGKNQDVIVLALPRGGVPVGYEIAKRLNAPLDVLVARKLGAPFNSEFGIGAIAPGNIKVLDQTAITYLGISENEIKQIEKEEREELNRRIKEYRGLSLASLKNKTVILVDDGLATGITARAAIKAVLEQHPQRLIIAIPVCSIDAVAGIRSIVRPMKDEVVCLTTPYDFSAVGLWYKSFGQVSDLEVINLLSKARANALKKPQRKAKAL